MLGRFLSCTLLLVLLVFYVYSAPQGDSSKAEVPQPATLHARVVALDETGRATLVLEKPLPSRITFYVEPMTAPAADDKGQLLLALQILEKLKFSIQPGNFVQLKKQRFKISQIVFSGSSNLDKLRGAVPE